MSTIPVDYQRQTVQKLRSLIVSLGIVTDYSINGMRKAELIELVRKVAFSRFFQSLLLIISTLSQKNKTKVMMM
jgi:hypothetical protein